MIDRRTTAETVLGGYRLPADANILICPYVTHRDPEFWSDPERFDPDRFGETLAHEIGHYKRKHILQGLAMLVQQVAVLRGVLPREAASDQEVEDLGEGL